ncbi:uncharacterized protein LOC142317821 [Lycorma delicatula]|uniref:uncharacterized protein LOC142317821 n=1 Tax=Lycorma delicatula TaxID=130591 RepID=UPI003F5153F4
MRADKIQTDQVEEEEQKRFRNFVKRRIRLERYFAFCMTLKALTYGDVDIFSEAVAAAVNYDLPSNITNLPVQLPTIRPTSQVPHHKSLQNKYYVARTQRAVIYSKAENILDAIGIEGRSCIMRTLCETVQWIPNGGTLIHQLLRIIFTIPIEMMVTDEPSQHWQYRAAQISGLKNQECRRLFHRCPISFLALALSLRPHYIHK